MSEPIAITPDAPGRPRTSQIVRSLKAAAAKLGVSVRALHNWRAEGCPGFEADGRVDLAQVAPWYEARRHGREGSIEAKDEKTREEIRKLRIANDAKEGRLIERQFVAAAMQRAAGRLNAFRSKSEAEHPLRFAAAAGDVGACREIIRGVWDEIFAELHRLNECFEEQPKK